MYILHRDSTSEREWSVREAYIMEFHEKHLFVFALRLLYINLYIYIVCGVEQKFWMGFENSFHGNWL